jgi:hypothetical protein
MQLRRSYVLGLLLAAGWAWAPPARAQMLRPATVDPGPWSMQARVGLLMPLGILTHIERMGGNAGFGVGYRLLPRLELRLDGSVDFLLGREAPFTGLLVSKMPSMSLWSWRVGLEGWLTPPESNWMATVGVLGGATIMDTDDSSTFSAAPDGSRDFTHTYPGLDASLLVGYRAGDQVVLFLTTRARGVFTSSQDTQVFSRFSTEMDPAGFSSAWVLPVQAGIRIQF